MMARQTPHPAIRAVARLSPFPPVSDYSVRGGGSVRAEPREHWPRRPCGKRPYPIAEEFIANLERSEVARVGKSMLARPPASGSFANDR